MNKKSVIFVILCSVILGGLSGWFFVRFIAPRLNTVSIFRRVNFLPTSSPLVINTREEVRVIEGSDSVAAIQRAKPWLVGILSGKDVSTAKLQASGILITGDGIIATTKQALGSPAEQVFTVMLSDGKILSATLAALDPASDLAFIKVDGNNFATVPFGQPKELKLGQRIILLSSSLGQYQAKDVITYLSSETRDQITPQVLSSERIYSTFGVGNTTGMLEGTMVLSLDAQVQGIYSQSGVITADTIRSAMNSYFRNNNTIVRNLVGINYLNISKGLAELYKLPEGVILRKDQKNPAVIPQSPAALAGLLEDDVITRVDDVQINFDNSFEELVMRKNPGDTVKLRVERKGQTLNINLILGKR